MGYLPTLIAMFLFPAVFAAGVAIAIGGIIGRAISVAPCCARCRHGVALSLQSLRAPCPECGGDLSTSDGVRYFRRVRQPSRIGLGILVAVLAFAVPMLVRGLTMRSSPSVSAATPVNELAAQIAGHDPINFFSLSEAQRRFTSGTLSDADLTTIARAIIAGRGGEAGTFAQNSEVQLVVAADAKKLLSEEELLSFVRSLSEPPTLTIPSKIRTHYEIAIPGWPPAQNDVVRREADLVGVRLDESDLTILDSSNGQPISRVTFGVFARIAFTAPPGKHQIHATFEESYTLGQASAPRLKMTRTIDLPVEILDANAPTWIETETPASRRAEVEAACIAVAVALDADASGTECSIRLDYRVTPVDALSFGFDIVVLLDGVEHPVARHVIGRAGGTITEWPATWGDGTMPVPSGRLPSEATVIFRPNPSLLETTAGVERLWGGEIRRDHVPVRTTLGAKPAAPPAGGSQ